MVIAAGSVIKEPSKGATTKIDNHHAAGVRLPMEATERKQVSAN